MYPIITESRAGNDGLGVVVTPGTVAYVTTGGELVVTLVHLHFTRFLGTRTVCSGHCTCSYRRIELSHVIH